jgi:hypothetical protein
MKSFNALPERGASPLPGLTWRHKMRIPVDNLILLTNCRL